MIFILYYIVASQPAFSRFEGEPTAARSRCNQGAVSACQSEHRRGESVCRGHVAALDEKLAPVARDVALLARRRGDLAAALRNAEAELESIRREREFSAALEKSAGKRPPALPANLSLESVFQLDRFGTAWGRNFPRAWQEKLIAQESALVASREKITAAQSENESKISALSAAKDELDAQRSHWLGDADLHVRMWQRGCESRFCPGD